MAADRDKIEKVEGLVRRKPGLTATQLALEMYGGAAITSAWLRNADCSSSLAGSSAMEMAVPAIRSHITRVRSVDCLCSRWCAELDAKGDASHANHSQFIDLTAVTYVSGVVSDSYHASARGGALTVTSSGTVVATIDFVGTYSSGNFHLASGAGGTGITDPAVQNGGQAIAPTSRCSATTSRASRPAATAVSPSRARGKPSHRRC